MASIVAARLGGFPSIWLASGLIDFDFERKAGRRIRGVYGRTVASRAGRQAAKKVDLGEELQKVAGPHGARLHEILTSVTGEACAHEDVEDVVHGPNAIDAVRFTVAVPFAGAGRTNRARQYDAQFP